MTTTPPPDTKVQSETLEQIAERIVATLQDRNNIILPDAGWLKGEILSALRNERERAIRIMNQFAACRDRDQPTHCVDCDLRHKAIAAIKAGGVAKATENMRELCSDWKSRSDYYSADEPFAAHGDD